MLHKKKSVRNFFVGVVLFGSLVSCGHSESTMDSSVGMLSKADEVKQGGSLYQKYQQKFPKNLMELTINDYMKLWPNQGILMQGVDGSEHVVYSTAETVQNVLTSIEESYPTFNQEEFLQAEADKLALENHLMNATTLEGSELTEEEVEATLQQKLEEKMQRIAAEKAYIMVHELVSPETQDKIRVEAQQMGQWVSVGANGSVLFTKKQTEMLIESVWTFLDANVAKRTAEWTLTMGAYRDYVYSGGDNDKKNALIHSYWAARCADSASRVMWVDPDRARRWGEAFTQARENVEADGRWSASAKMDLQNDTVGANVFRDHAYKDNVYIKIKLGWIKIKIKIGSWTLCNIGTVEQVLKDKSANAQKAWWGKPERDTTDVIDAWRDGEFSSVRLNPAPGVRTLVYFKE